MRPDPSAFSISRRAARVAPFLAMDVLAAAAVKERRGEAVVHMEVGQPSAPAPRAVLAAAQAALAGGRIPYTEALGIAPLRERIARHCAEAYGVAVAPERVVVTTGSSAGFVLAFLALFDAGARVAIAEPGYPAYRSILQALDLEPVPLRLSAEDGFVPTPALVRAAQAGRPLAGLLVMSPANPSGTMLDPVGLAELGRTCRALNLAFVSDEIYHGLTYGVPAATALASDPDAVIINSFSKYYCMTGWRIGWMVVPERLVRPIERLAQNLYISAPYLSQVAALAAFDAVEELEAVKADYARARALLLNELPGLGLGDVHPADGAFYLYADVARLTNDSAEFCRRMLAEAGVAATPGLDFDPVDGAHHLRLSFAGGEAAAAEAVRRLRGWLG
ncbi:pyridoxal phosphate-dependent aminotransferase [Methylobacterium isbiliense]|jgi:aspartate/methionine/tyrosine aminotransferase|uniref:8-amino-7-oxononanoate synthase n=1 Tax=Methylobacterium isbiliense TaxID=315478 RepID=A0ABQ4SDG0_9HYPH|nr:aminotransferase class I/II-fold pyridoxal phosphate-dependent enzyme [Methylobacterium isbiliense]MDN3626726.1 aminotransferase class I/II-fold pyridoxal phosphate-dependent enzyme [Methylobacterium isbiliense]GJE01257.1 Aspartate aminotransferase [Methylobacterium isbiliense]